MGTIADKLNAILNTKEAIKQAIIDKGVKVADDTVFADYPAKINEIQAGSGEGGSDEFFNLRTDNGTDMSHLFYGFTGKELDLSSWDTSNVKYMDHMFYMCTSLQTLDVRNFNMNKIYNKPLNMFSGCSALYELRLDNCDNYTIYMIIELSNFPTGELKDATRKIYVHPDNVGKLTAPEGWKFYDCYTDEEIVPDEEPEKPELTVYVAGEYERNDDITEVYTLVTKEHNDLHNMFLRCENLTTINGIDQWDTSNVENMKQMFAWCRSLKTLNLSSFNTSNVRDMESMFDCCTSLETLDISNFDMSNVENTSRMMFERCEKLQELRLDNCDYDTINKIITSDDFPTDNVNIDGIIDTRKMYVQEANIGDLEEPDGWEFIYVEAKKE